MQLPVDVAGGHRKPPGRVEGQVRGVEETPAEGGECRSIAPQLSAATKALEMAGFELVASGLTFGMEHPREAAADGYAIDEVQRMVMKSTGGPRYEGN